jgi:hypothetical protein
MTHKLAGCVLTLLLLSAGIASADVFSFSYTSLSGPLITASGTIMATPTTDGVFTITDVTGLRNGAAITFIPGNTADIDADDILWYPANPTYLLTRGRVTAHLDQRPASTTNIRATPESIPGLRSTSTLARFQTAV